MFYFSVLVSWVYLQGCEYVSGLYSGRNQTVFLTGKQTVCTHPDPHPTGAADIFFSLVLNAFLKADLFFSTQCSPSNKETAYFHDTCHSVHLACCNKTVWKAIVKATSLFILLSQVPSSTQKLQEISTLSSIYRDVVLSHRHVVRKIPNSITRRSFAIFAIWSAYCRWLLSNACYEQGEHALYAEPRIYC